MWAMWQTSVLTDKSQILAYLETDRLYAAYAIGDLEPGMYEQCTWAGAARGGQLGALALHFSGLTLPALVLMGNPEGLRAILSAELCPERAYLTCRESLLPVTQAFYAWEKMDPMWRMVLQPDRFRPALGDAVRLTPDQAEDLIALYAEGWGGAFMPAQVAQGVFYGVYADGQMVAVAGTHLVSPTYGVAAMGNIYTHPGYRGRGYGTATTAAVADALLRMGIRDVVLNVHQGNALAIRLYERLGFYRHCPFLEGPANARQARKARCT
jgi:ribosomal protein S18 acetylase RimI-like enzyme